MADDPEESLNDLADAEPAPEQQQKAQEFLERAAPLRQKYADFDEVVSREVFSPVVVEALYDSPVGPEIAYLLGRNQAEALKIAALPEGQQLRRFGAIEHRVQQEAAEEEAAAAARPAEPEAREPTEDEQMQNEMVAEARRRAAPSWMR